MSTEPYENITKFFDNFSTSSAATLVSERFLCWFHHELLPSTSQLRSTVTLQLLQCLLVFFCFIIVPWAAFFLNIIGGDKRAGDSTMATKKDTTACCVDDDASKATFIKRDVDENRSEEIPTIVKNASEGKKGEESPKDEDSMAEKDMAPLHFNILRSPARLRGMARPSSSRSSSFSRSRSASPVPTHSQSGLSLGETGGERGRISGPPNNAVSRSSSDHSLESNPICSVVDKHGHQHVITEDMLTDRLGFEEVIAPHQSPHGSCSMLPSVNERMSEESLDDCHAFSDVKVNTRRMSWGSERQNSAGGGGSVQGSVGGEPGSCNNSVLGTLEEEEGSSAEEGDDGEEVMVTGEVGESEANPNILAAVTSPERSKEEETKIMFEMLELVSTDDERRRLLEAEQKHPGLESENKEVPLSAS